MEKNLKDLIVKPGEYAYILNEQSGALQVITGPGKVSLEATDRPVRFERDDDREAGRPPRFKTCSIQESIQANAAVPEGWYLVLKNPESNDKHPKEGKKEEFETGTLRIGEKVIVQGPASFSLYPGQQETLIRGHSLRSNNYLTCRVYNADAANKHKENAVVTAQGEGGGETARPIEAKEVYPANMTMGLEFIIKGTDVGSFIPATGVEVLRDPETEEFTRSACTLTQLQYCILDGQDGKARHEKGPQVVFPKATEVFRTVKGRGDDSKAVRKFQAIELNDESGLHLKVIAKCEFLGTQHEQGDEIWITGKETKLYFPQAELAIIKQGASEQIYATVVSKGEGRYVLDKTSADVELVKGPAMLIPDPRTRVMVQRALSDRETELLYPGNHAALGFNRDLRGEAVGAASDAMLGSMASSRRLRSKGIEEYSGTVMYESASVAGAAADDGQWANEQAARQHGGDSLRRSTKFTPPKTIRLDNKFNGAVRIDVHAGYAICIKNKLGSRRVVVGPEATLLEYDETPVSFTVSTGKPKNEGGTQKKEDVYLRIRANRITDVVRVQTVDFVDLSIRLSYRTNFVEEHKADWWSVDNFVKWLCEHFAARLRERFRGVTLGEAQARGFDIVREVVLGEAKEGGKSRVVFQENGLEVYDVEVMGVDIADQALGSQIQTAQREIVALETKKTLRGRALHIQVELDAVTRAQAALVAETATVLADHATTREKAKLQENRLVVENKQSLDIAAQDAIKAVAEKIELASIVRRGTQKLDQDLRHAAIEAAQRLEVARAGSSSAFRVNEIKAASPELKAAIINLSKIIGDSAALRELGIPALMTGQSMEDILSRLSLGGGLANGSGALLHSMLPDRHAVELSRKTPEIKSEPATKQ